MSSGWNPSTAEAKQIVGVELSCLMGGTPTSKSRNPVKHRLKTGATIWVFYEDEQLTASVQGTEAQIAETKQRLAAGEQKLIE